LPKWIRIAEKKASEISDMYSSTSSQSGENSLDEDFQHKIEKDITGKEIKTGCTYVSGI
jgi:hypothetical protein